MNRPEAEKFFRLLFAAAPDDAAVVVSAFPSKESIALSADNFAGLVEAASAAESDRQDAYFSVCCVGTDFEAKGRGTKPDFRYGVCLWADLDVRSPAHKADPATLPPTVEDAAGLLDEVGLSPTAIVASGHGLHAYFVLASPVKFGPGGALSAEGLHFASVAEALQARIRDAAKAKGWHVDLVADVPRILRVPGTSNFKLPGDVRTVELLLDDGPLTDFGDAAETLGLTREPVRGKISSSPASAATANGSATTPDAAASASGAPSSFDPDTVRDRLRNLRNVSQKKFFEKVIAGESFAEPGERDRMLQRAASVIAFVAPEFEADQLVEVLRPSLETWAAETGSKGIDFEVEKAQEKLVRAVADARRAKAEEEQRRQRIRALLGADEGPAKAPTAPTGETPATEAPAASGDAPEAGAPRPINRVTSAPPIAPGFAPYLESELDACAADLGCTLFELNKRWIIQHKSAYFVLVDGRYRRPITDNELEVSLPRDLKRSPVEFWIEKASGEGQRPAKVQEILRQHATVARTLVSSLSAQRSIYYGDTETFVEAVCPVRPIEPKFDQDVDDWLRLFFGDEVEKGLDWVATATDLDHYTCALYLSGPPETGKTLFAGGLSRLWTVGGPSELGRILENFNEDLMRSPLIFADEHIPQGSRGHRTSTELRNLVGNNRRTLNRKFLPQAPLVGAIRLILAANNDRLLAFSEDLSAHDLEAVAERFLYINTAGAQGFFKKFPGGKAPDGWVDGDTIAAHALWLRENRYVSHDGRFLVSGSRSKMLSMLATSGRAAGVVEFLAKYLCASPNARQPIDTKKLIIVGKGELFVNTLAVADNWDLFVQNDRPQSTNKIGRHLAGLSVSDGEQVIKGTRYHKINYELILDWMRENQVGDIDQARALIDG